MAHIHYKFASKRSSDTVIFDGPHITLKELKRLIMEKEKLRSGDCDLQITNAQTKEEFTDDEGQIAKGSSVVVRRIPVVGARSSSNAKIRNIERSDGHLHQPFGAVRAMGAQSSSSTLPLFSKMTNLAFADASEEDKLKVLVNQSLYDSMSYNMKVGPGLPANYSCFRCGSTGHHIRNCPSSGDKSTEAPLRIKKSTGIPRSFMVEVDDPSIKGAMLTNCGHYAIPAIHAKAYAVGKKEKPPFVPQELPESKDEEPVPKELLCLICKEMLSDAVVIPCCGNSFCDDCIRTALLDSDQHTCPTCKQSDVSPDTLIANKFLRQAVNTFQKEQGQSKSSTGSDGTSQSVNPAWAPDPVLKKKPHQSAPKQQTQEPQSTAQGGLAPPRTTGPTPPPTVTTAPLQQLQTQTNTFKNEPAEQACEEAVAAEPHEEGSVADAASAVAVAAVSLSTSEETPHTVSITPQQSAPDPLPGPSWPPAYWESAPPFSSSSATYPPVPPPLFPSPRFPGFPAAQHHLIGYPPGYPAASPVWSLQPPQGPPIPPLCSSTHDWYKHQRENNETRSPHRGSAHRRSSSRSRSSKSSHSYSRSSSRSRSRSRSVSRSRHHSPYSRSRQLHTRSHSSYTHSYGHKRSPTPSSSSSPRLSRHSRSKSPSDHRKKSHHSRHHGKKTSSGRSSSGRRGEGGQRGRGSEDSHASDQRAKPNSSVELDRQRYLQWKRDYQEWCDKYLSSYISHFNQPPPLLNLPPSPRRLWEDTEGNGCGSRAEVESSSRRGGSTARANDRSTPSRSSSDCCSTASQSSIDGRSSPSQSSNHSRSPASHMSTDGYSTPSKPRDADHTEDGRKDARRHPRSYKDDPPGLEKTSSRESVQLSVKGSQHLKFKRERREHNNSEKDKKQASKGSGKTYSGKSKSDSRSEKPGKRKGEGASAETRSSKCLKTSTSEVCKSEPQHPSDKNGSGKEKKSQPVSERNIWEEGMMVKPQKRISINISLDARKKEEKNRQTPQSSAGKPGGDVQKSDNGGEEKANEMELSGAPGGEPKEEIYPDEREQSPIRKKDVSDHQDQVTEEGQKKEGWHCIFPHDEEESKRVKASANKEVTTGGGRSTQKEGKGGGQERKEFFTADNVSVETESRVEVKLRTEAKEDGTRSLSEQDKAEGEDAGRHGSHGNGVERMLVAGAPKENTKERIKQVPGSKWEEEESAKKEQEEEFKAESSLWSVSKMEKSTFSGSHCGTASSSGKDRFYRSSSWRDWKREKEMETDRTRQKETGKQAQERRKREEKHRDCEEEESERNLRDEQGEIQGHQLHQCHDRLPAPSDKAKDKAAGNQQYPPPLRPHSWGEEKGPLPSEGTQKSENDVMVGKKAWMEKSPDNVIKVCRLQGDGVKKAL